MFLFKTGSIPKVENQSAQRNAIPPVEDNIESQITSQSVNDITNNLHGYSDSFSGCTRTPINQLSFESVYVLIANYDLHVKETLRLYGNRISTGQTQLLMSQLALQGMKLIKDSQVKKNAGKGNIDSRDMAMLLHRMQNSSYLKSYPTMKQFFDICSTKYGAYLNQQQELPELTQVTYSITRP